MKQLYGVVVALVTPIAKTGRIDLQTTERLADALIGTGVNCLYPCGTTGEMLRMSADERKQVAEAVVKTANGRVPVFIHTGTNDIASTVALSKHAYTIGANGVGIITPQFYSCNEREIVNYYASICNALPADFPVYLYSIPQCAANTLPVSAAKEILSRTQNVAGIKYSLNDFMTTADYLEVSPDWNVLHGCDSLFSSYLMLGCAGTVSGVANVFPEPFVRIYRAYCNGDLKSVQHWQVLARKFTNTLKCGSNMAYFKSGLKLRGLDAGHMRSPQLDLTGAEEAQLKEELESLCRGTGLELPFPATMV